MNSKTTLKKGILLLPILFFTLFLSAQTPIYNFQQVDSLPTFQTCPTVSKSAVEPWIECFFPKVEKMVIDSIESMSQQVGMTFEGTIKVNFVIDETGKVVEMEVKNKPHPILKKAAKDVLTSLSDLKPAKLKGEAVAVNITLEIEHYPDGKKNVGSDDETIYSEVKIMPRFPGCETAYATNEEKKKCADRQMLKFIYSRIKYPALARENGIEGTSIVTFVIEKDGSMSNILLVKDLKRGGGQEFLRVVNIMAEQGGIWTSGELNGETVRVQYHLPINFRLE